MRLRYAVALVLSLSGGSGGTRRVAADEPAPSPDEPAARAVSARDRARASFEHARTLYRLTRFAEALAAFSEAYEALPEPAFLYNIAQCQRELGHDEDAIRVYQQYLATTEPSDPAHQDVRHIVTELQQRVAERAKAVAQLTLLSRERERERERELEVARQARVEAERRTGSATHARALLVSGGVLGCLGLIGLGAGVGAITSMNDASSTLFTDANAGAVYDPSLGRRYELDRSLGIAFFAVGGSLTAIGAALVGRGLWERRLLRSAR